MKYVLVHLGVVIFFLNTSAAQKLAAGGSHSLVICTDSIGTSWGANYSGQLGNGNTTSTNFPVLVNFTNKFTAAGSGWEHSLALRKDSTVWAWGENGYGQLGDSSFTDRWSPVRTKILSNVISISQGHIHTHSLAAKSDGSAWAWGYNSTGKLGDNSTTTRFAPVQVHGPNNIGFLAGITQTAGGHDYSLALKNDGTAWAWGLNSFGQLGDSSNTQRLTPVKVKNLSGATAISVGDWSSYALKNDSTVWAWGYNGSGRLGDNTLNSHIAAIQVHGANDIGFLTEIVKISAGETFCLALKSDSTLWSWGKNDVGQLGDNSLINRYTPVQVVGPGGVGFLTGIVAVAGGARHAVALKSDGTLWCWGDNGYGQLGDGSYNQSIYPVQVMAVCPLITQVEESTKEFPAIIFPNPSTGIFTVEFRKDIKILEVNVYNSIGKKVIRKELGKFYTGTGAELNLSKHPDGIYFVSFLIGESTFFRKIIKQQ